MPELSKSNFKIPILHQLQGHQLRGQYWFLYWIGRIVYKSGIYYANFHFLNKSTPDNFFRNIYKAKKFTVELEASLISLLDIGAIFDLNGIYVCKSEDYLTKSGIISISLEPTDRPINSSINFGLRKYCELLSDNDLKGSAYFEKTIIKNGTKCTVIIPNYVICSYLYFRNRFITNEILSSTIFSLFDLESFILNEDQGFKTGTLLYDNRKVLPQEIQSIAQFLFINNNLGFKSINFISSHLQQMFSTSKERECDGAYIMTDLPFPTKIDMELTGQFVYDEAQSYFIAYEVKNIHFEENIFSIDKLVLEPKYKNENNYSSLSLKRSYVKLNFNEKLGISQKDNTASIRRKYSLDFGLKTYINWYPNKENREPELITFYSRFKRENDFSIKFPEDIYSYNKEFIQEIRLDRRFKIKYMYLNNLKLNYGCTQITIDGNFYKMLVLEIIFKRNYFYKIELTNYFTVTLCKEQKSTKITEIDLKIIIEKIINDFSFENGYYRKATKRDIEDYRRKFNINICDISTLQRNSVPLETIIKKATKKIKKIIEVTVAKSA